MKNIVIAALAVFVLFEGVVFAANRPHNLGYVALSVSSGTITEITNSTAPTVGYLRYCTNCAANGGSGTICVSTGAANFNQFVLSTGTVCK